MRLVAITDDCKYADKVMLLGEEFDVPDGDAEAARLLVGFGKAKQTVERGPRRQKYSRRDMRAED